MPESQLVQWLNQLYLPLDNKVTVATYSEGTTYASLSQMYQVSPTMKKEILPSGQWSLRAPSLGKSSLDEAKGTQRTRRHVKRAWEEFKSSLGSGERAEAKEVTFGVVWGVIGDPVLRRTDLTGLHLRCTTIH
ncbi:uncharacterized protein LOC121859530, partial [Homarus americanus]